MRRHHLVLTSVLVMLATALAGCSADNPAAPTDDGGIVHAEKSSTYCHIYGNVWKLDGTRAVGVSVRIDVGYNGVFTQVATVTTGEYGEYAFDYYLYDGAQVRCASLRDVETVDWDNGAYVYVRLDEIQGSHIYDDLYAQP